MKTLTASSPQLTAAAKRTPDIGETRIWDEDERLARGIPHNLKNDHPPTLPQPQKVQTAPRETLFSPKTAYSHARDAGVGELAAAKAEDFH